VVNRSGEGATLPEPMQARAVAAAFLVMLSLGVGALSLGI
jgi:hypothetical protein